MSRSSMLLLVVAIAAAAGSVSARPDAILQRPSQIVAQQQSSIVNEVVSALQGWVSNAAAESSASNGAVEKRDEDDFYVLIKYIIRPADQKGFVKQWLNVKDDVEGKEGNKRYTLSKTLTDNLLLYSYQQWESKQDFYEHIKSKAVEPLAEFIKDKDIPLFLTSLIPVESIDEDDSHRHSHRHTGDLVDMASSFMDLQGVMPTSQPLVEAMHSHLIRDEPRELGNVIVLTKFLVKPSETRDFVEAFLKVREEAIEEKGNLIYNLSKPLTDNVSFYAYAEWADREAFKNHIKSDYVKDFAEYITEESIPLVITGLIPIEDLDN